MSYLSTFRRPIFLIPWEAQNHTLIWTVNVAAEKVEQSKTLVLVGIGLSSDRPILHYKRND